MSDLFLEATEKCAADFQLPTFTMIIAPSSRVREVNLFFPPMIMQLSYGACGVGKSVEGHPPHPRAISGSFFIAGDRRSELLPATQNNNYRKSVNLMV
jgi:hypothetical protein